MLRNQTQYLSWPHTQINALLLLSTIPENEILHTSTFLFQALLEACLNVFLQPCKRYAYPETEKGCKRHTRKKGLFSASFVRLLGRPGMQRTWWRSCFDTKRRRWVVRSHSPLEAVGAAFVWWDTEGAAGNTWSTWRQDITTPFY